MPLSPSGRELAERLFRQKMDEERVSRAKAERDAEQAARGDYNAMGQATRFAHIFEASIEPVARAFIDSRLEAFKADGSALEKTDVDQIMEELRKVLDARVSNGFDQFQRRAPVMLTQQREAFATSFRLTAQRAADRLLNELRVEQLRQELSRKAVEGKQAADVPRDVLTQLPNREAAEARLGAELALANPSSPLVVIFLDLDDFKPINDGLGHDAGDKVLVSVAAFLRSIAESRGGAYRLAGDEFIIVLPSTSVDEARVFGERVRAGIEELRFSGFAESVTSSVGAAVIRSGGATFKGAVKAADALMYQSKRRSRNTVTVMEFDGGALSNEESAARAAAEVPSKT